MCRWAEANLSVISHNKAVFRKRLLTWLVGFDVRVSITVRIRWRDPHLEFWEIRRTVTPAFVFTRPLRAPEYVFIMSAEGQKGKLVTQRAPSRDKANQNKVDTFCKRPAGGCSSARLRTVWRQQFGKWSPSTWRKPPRSALSAEEATGRRIWTAAPPARSLLRRFDQRGDAAAPDTSPRREGAARRWSCRRSCLRRKLMDCSRVLVIVGGRKQYKALVGVASMRK